MKKSFTTFFPFQDIQFPRLIVIFGQGATGGETRLLVLLLLVLCPAGLLLLRLAYN
jgi:hypothetical protein